MELLPAGAVKEGETIEVTHDSIGGNGGFIVRKDGRLYGYLNRCPHVGAPLNLMPDRFWDAEGRFLNCTMHGALFRPDDGLCVAGPCAGKSLRRLPVLVAPSGAVLLPSKPLRALLNATDFV